MMKKYFVTKRDREMGMTLLKAANELYRAVNIYIVNNNILDPFVRDSIKTARELEDLAATYLGFKDSYEMFAFGVKNSN